ncbi:calcium-binding protein [Zoogloea dura]|uniref:Uncharacterized protein n=1 Tax=Zoogloea dura TaxID=2728840 RepID=A0A848G9C2_9RHOO|nr:carbohydrate-binding domain-containing protein [Zoogloea dura]NML27864.1 hypothetical protein [Zoogloea dura]
MSNDSIQNFLKYANLQMAAEATLEKGSNIGSPIITSGIPVLPPKYLTDGNNHASKFPSPLASSFLAEGWEIIAHQPNTSTGFSATLFKNNKTKELVISFRSTEFVDDAVRDNQATNKMEIKEHGWALGQIADMEAWWEKLQANGVLTRDAKVTVTGYSLGGHLATAFSLLHGTERVSAVYTFNGAGVGDVHSNTSLDAVISEFQRRRTNTDGEQIRFSDARIQKLYRDIRSKFNAGTRPTDADFELIDRTAGSVSEKGIIRQALTNIRTIWAEIDRVAALKEYSEGTKPVAVSALSTDGRTVQIEAVKLDYQLAVLMADPSISPYRTNVALSGWDAISNRNLRGTVVGLPSYDIYGAQSPSGVANSQWHYGKGTPIYIEDQPLARGDVLLSALVETVNYADAKLLVDYYTTNDFGDTHSLVLLVDSLAVQDLFARLAPLVTREELAGIFSAATHTERETILFSQGKAEGYTLETILDGLFLTVTGVDRRLRFLRTGAGESLDTGNTWHDMTAREALHSAISDLKNNDAFKALAGKVTLVTPTTDPNTARTDFGQFLALVNLTPFALKTTDADALAALKKANEALAQAWAADAQLTSTQRAAGQGNYSDLWLADRAAMLSWLQQANKDNNPNLESSKIGKEAWAFNDLESGQNITVRPDGAFVAITPHKVEFGSTADDALSGAELTDHLFGGDGNDTLTGNSGADILQGGQGTDTYIVNASGGGDIIVDSDGKGVIKWSISGTQYTLAGSKKLSNGTWISEDKRFVFSLTANAAGGDDLNVAADGGVLRVRNFSSGQLGITLATEDSPKPTGAGTAGNDFLSMGGATQASGLAGNDLFNGADGSIDEWVDGGADRDILIGRAGDDTLLGGTGDDLIIGGNGADLIDCGDGADVVLAGTVYQYHKDNQIINRARSWDGWWSFEADYWQIKILSQDQLVYIDDPAAQEYWHRDSEYDPSFSYGYHTFMFQYSYSAGAPPTTSGIDRDSSITPASSRMALGADTILGGAGNDIIGGSGADDLIDGGEGNDIISGLEGNEQLFGGKGDDQIAGNQGKDLVDGNSGNDRLWGGIDADTILGSGGNDYIHGDFGASGFEVPATIYALSGNDLLLGGDGEDSLRGDGGNDTLFGEADNDLLVGDDANLNITYHGNDLLDGGTGSDTLSGLGGNDSLFGGEGADFLVGDNDGANPLPDATPGADWLDGGAGDDQLEGNDGNDTLIGGIGLDILSGGDGDDVYIFEKGDFLVDAEGKSDAIIDSGGNDIILIKGYRRDEAYLTQANGDQDFVVLSTLGGESIQVSESWGNTIEKVLFQDSGSLAAQQSSQPSLLRTALAAEASSEQASATAFWNEGYSEVSFQELFSRSPYTLNWTGKGNTADAFFGGTKDDSILGSDGNDQLFGHAGNDWLDGGRDNDTLSGGQGNDWLLGGEGQDVILLEDDFGHDLITEDTQITRQFQDTIRFAGSVTQSSLSFFRNGNQLVLFKDPDNWAAVSEYFGPAGAPSIARIEFADGGSMDYAAVLSLCGTDANVSIGFGTQGDDAIDARGSANIQSTVLLFDGNDTFLNTLAARDKVFGGNGNDTIFGDDPEEFNTMYASPEAADAVYKADYLDGGDGDDELYGGSGKDTLLGGKGDDLLWGGKGDDVYLINVGDGSDRIINYEKTPTDTANDEVRFGEGIVPEDLTLLRSGNDLLVTDREYRFQLNIQGAFSGGQDLSSFSCVDLFRFSNGQTWTLSQLNERVQYSTPGDDVIYLQGGFRLVHANSGDDEIWGTSNPDSIYGDDGNDSLHGEPGIDSLIGGKGDDTYWVSNPGAERYVPTTPEFEDIVIEEVDSGTDTLVVDTFNATLPDNVENLVVSDIKQISNRYSGDPWMLTYSDHWYQGNSLNNVIDSSAAHRPPMFANVKLHGGGGSDTLIGGINDETYFVDDPTDVVIETGSGDAESTDGVEASFSYALPDHVENLRLTAENTRGEGNALNNVLTSQGGSTLVGGDGDDTYFTPASSTVVEAANGGFDVLNIVRDTSLAEGDGIDGTFRITDYANFEGLTLAGGNNPILIGGDGSDVLEISSAWTGTIEGAAGNDSLFLLSTTGGQVDGGNGNDYIESRPFSGNSGLPTGLILGGEGDDTINLFDSIYTVDGGSGNDSVKLNGRGAYIRFGPGSGIDRVECAADEWTEIQLSSGIRPSDITLTKENGETVLSLSDGSRLTIQGTSPSLRFGDEFWDASMVEAYLNGDQRITGTVGNDTLSGGNGSDSIIGDAGNDVIQGLGGNDSLNGNEGDDLIHGGQGNDSITADSGQDTLFGDDGDDTLEGGDGNTTIEGGAGNDRILMGQGSDRLILSGDFGNDTVQWFRSKNDSIVISGIQGPNALKLSTNTHMSDLLIEVIGTGNKVTLAGFFSPAVESNNIDETRIGISDGIGGLRWLTADEIKADLLGATDGNDTLSGLIGSDDILYGLKGDDDLSALAGADTLIGGSGSDTYRFTLDGGFDRVLIDNAATDGSPDDIDRIAFRQYSSPPDSVEYLRIKDDLIINASRYDNSRRVEVSGYFSADGTTGRTVDFISLGESGSPSSGWSYAQIKSKAVTASGLAIEGNDEANNIFGTIGDDTLGGGAGNDSIDGGAGNDLVSGGLGNNTYLFGKGDGQDIIASFEDTTAGKLNTLQLKPGVLPNEILVSRSGADLRISISGTGDTVTLKDFFYQDSPTSTRNPVQQLRFVDGTTWDLNTIVAKLLPANLDLAGTAAADTLNGSAGNDTLYGQAGNDQLHGHGGNDQLFGDRAKATIVVSARATLAAGVGAQMEVWLDGKKIGSIVVDSTTTKTYQFTTDLNISTEASKLDLLFTNDAVINGEDRNLIVSSVKLNGHEMKPTDPGVTLDKGGGATAFDNKDVIPGQAGLYWNGALRFTLPVSVFGSAGADSLFGDQGNDTLDGGAGDDLLDGGEGSDLLTGGAGNDTYVVDLAGDVITELAAGGTDTVQASLTYTLGAQLENLTLTGGSALNGTGNALANILIGNANNNTLDGMGGNDTLCGGAGNNTYLFGKGDGNDLITAFDDATAGKLNTLLFKSGVTTDDVSLGRSDGDLVITLRGTNDSVTVQDFFKEDSSANSRNPVQQIQFSGGPTWDLSTIKNMAFLGSVGPDSLSGSTAADTLYGQAGADQLHGLGGDDQLFGDRTKATIIVSARATLAAGVGAQMEVWLDGKKIGSIVVDSTTTKTYQFTTDLHIGTEASKLDLLFTNDAVINGEDRNLIVSSVKLNGHEMKPTDPGVTLDKGGGATAFDNKDVIPGQAGLYWNGALRFTLPVSIFGSAGADSLFGDQGNDTLDGGAGNDLLNGGANSDTYMFSRGTGSDRIMEDDATVGNTDVLSIGAGVTADQLWFRRVGSDLEVSIIGSADKTTIDNWFNGSAYHVEQFKVTDGKTLLDSQVDALVSAMAGFAPPAAGQSTLPANYQSSLNPVIAANWH